MFPCPPEPTNVTRRHALAYAVARFQAAGIEPPRPDAEILLAHVLQVERLALFRDPDVRLLEPHLERFHALIERRSQREPLPYLTGMQPFLDFQLEVAPGALIPRPETELLVEIAAQGIRSPLPLVVDVGTGTGAAAIGIARLAPEAQIAATDVSSDALKIAHRNIERLGVRDRVGLYLGNLLDPVPGDWLGRVDAVVSNPPYIATEEICHLEPEVAFWEPRIALDGGDDGLSVIRRLAQDGRRWLRTGGWLFVEIGAGQQGATQQILRHFEYDHVSVRPDLSGTPRIAAGKKTGV